MVFGQTLELSEYRKLDRFVLGSPVDQFEDQIRLDVSISYGQDYYIFTGKEPDVFLGLRIRQIKLGFFDDLMNYIDFYFRKPDDAAFASLKENLTTMFGIPEEAEDADESGLLEAYRWTDDDLILHLKRFGPYASDWDEQNMTILVLRKAMSGD